MPDTFVAPKHSRYPGGGETTSSILDSILPSHPAESGPYDQTLRSEQYHHGLQGR